MAGLVSQAGGKDTTKKLRDLARDLRKSRRSFTLATLGTLEAQIKEELSTPGRGRVRWNRIRVRRPGKANRKVTAKAIAKAGRASIPGDPPAPDRGVLRNSIHSEFDDASQKGRVGTNNKYAAPLNFGTMRAGKNHNTVIAPRPFMEPALKKAEVAMTGSGIHVLRLVVHGNAQPVMGPVV